MLAEIERLLVVQDRDQTLKQLKRQEAQLPSEKSALEARLEATKQDYESRRLSLQQAEVERKKLELDEQSRRNTIGKYKTQQLQTRKNEEYQAFAHEIAQAEAAISLLETRELELMEEIDRLKPELAANETAFTERKKEISAALAALEQRGKAINERVTSILAERSSLTTGITEDSLDLYERLFKSKGDIAIVPLEHGICGGCHMSIPLQTGHHVDAEKTVVQCNNCGRILYRII